MIKTRHGADLTIQDCTNNTFCLDDIYTPNFKLPAEGDGKKTIVNKDYTLVEYRIKGGSILEKTFPDGQYDLTVT